MIEFDHADLIIPKGSDETAREFYCGLLKIQEIEKPPVLKKNGGLWLQLGNAQIHLSYEKREGVDPKKTKAHVALRVKDLASLRQELERRGLPVKEQDQLPGMIRIESEDPFGHRLEFIQRI
jgi:hypothetical protein